MWNSKSKYIWIKIVEKWELLLMTHYERNEDYESLKGCKSRPLVY